MREFTSLGFCSNSFSSDAASAAVSLLPSIARIRFLTAFTLSIELFQWQQSAYDCDLRLSRVTAE
ncbi:hypothetical protein Pan241w_54400 [Gimesia alba]|uniref:Uncharacterized protein n=1 Tax=Gimesia alba TaxID=2527973 RepID=A0A517RN68_9PLAN|nr:hypothetical protein Pan241w_54400 [Gimesia alba]